LSAVILSLAYFCLPTAAFAQASSQASSDKTLSPYFFVEGGDSGVDELPLRGNDVTVSITGVIADVRVKQIYENLGSVPISAKYIFPASTRAAVHGMTMTVGDHVIKAVVKEKQDAKRTYEKAKAEGKSASLLEEQRPNVFSMNVANIMPGDEISVELRYTELLIPTDGVYEFVYPTVVGPRYAEGSPAASAAASDVEARFRRAANAPSSDNWIRSPYLPEAELPSYDFDLKATLSTGIPVEEVASPSHRIAANWKSKSEVGFTLDDPEKTGGNRDFILRYRLAGKEIQSGLMLYEGEDLAENFFLLMMQPPERVSEAQIPGREYVFVVDVSGSMFGFPLDTAKVLLRDLVGNLNPNDRFNVLFFSGGSRLLAPRSLPATQSNVDSAINVIDNFRGGGGTSLLPALERAMNLPHDDDVSRSFVVVTDGYISAETDAFRYIRDHLGDANVFAFGIGSSVNRHLIEGIAAAGMGEPFVVTHSGEASGNARKFREYIAAPVLTNIEVGFDGFDAYDVEPLSVPDVLAERPVIVHGKWRGEATGSIEVSGISGHGAYAKRFDVDDVSPATTNHPLRYLWARSRIANLTLFDYGYESGAQKQEVTALGLKYNLLTKYTSFVAVHEIVRNTTGGSADVKQPLPLPEGVSHRAVGSGSVTVGAEPPFTWLLAMLVWFGGAALYVRARNNREARRAGVEGMS